MMNATLDEFQSNFNDPLINNNEMTKHQRAQAKVFFIPSCLAFSMIISSVSGQFIGIPLFIFLFIFSLWIAFCFFKKYISLFSSLNWLSLVIHFSFFNISEMTQTYHLILCGCSSLIILIVALQIIIRKKAFFFKIYLYPYIVYGLYYCYEREDYEFGWTTMVILYVYTIMSLIIYFKLLSKRWSYGEYFKWILVCLTFPISFMFTLCLIGTFYAFANWKYFMIIPMLSFFFQTAYFINKKKQFFAKQKAEDERLLFQVSEVLLCDDQDYLQNPRESIKGGKALNTCVSCYTQQSKLIYATCKHACICKLCGLQWLKQSMKKCPYCRMESNILYEVQRKQWIIFRIVKLYKFP